MNTLPCGNCALYRALHRPQPNSGRTKNLHRGHCLDRTIYAVNKPGEHTYPAGAKKEERLYGRHHIVMVSEKDIVPNCIAAKKKPK